MRRKSRNSRFPGSRIFAKNQYWNAVFLRRILSDDQDIGIKQDEQHYEAAHEQAESDSFERLPIHRDDLLWPRQKFQESLERRFAGGPRIIPIDAERQVVHGSPLRFRHPSNGATYNPAAAF